MNRRAFGDAGEERACEYLRRRGWTIAARNVRRGPGEIDIVARKRGVIAFIEVKRRTSTRFGSPAEAVNPEKRKRIARAAAIYMQERGMEDSKIRFDVIEILGGELRHIEGAFDATGLLD